MKIAALFSDFDGTLSPLHASREKVKIEKGTKLILKKISKNIPVCIITTKDYHFIHKKAPSLKAYAVVGGLEIVTKGKSFLLPGVSKKIFLIKKVLEKAKCMEGIKIEKKKSLNGQTIALCIDWTKSKKVPSKKIKELVSYARKIGLHIFKYKNRKYVDIFPIKIDKGKALKRLKKLFNVKGPVIYMGDSESDIPAFKEADISIGVIFDIKSPIKCDYFVQFKKVKDFLEKLYKNDLETNNFFN